jgi:hypothetical protein
MRHHFLRPARTVALVLAVSALALTGCAAPDNDAGPAASSSPSSSPSESTSGSTGSTPTSAQTPTSTPTDDYAPTLPPPELVTVAQLHEQFLRSGQTCDLAMSENHVAGAKESAWCTGSTVGFITFVDAADVEALLQLNADSVEPGLFLKGDHWVVSSEQPDALIAAQTTMGGELWPADSPFFAG